MTGGNKADKVYRCPVCSTELYEMGHVENGPVDWPVGGRIWIGEGLYGCRECIYPNNRFIAAPGGKLQGVTFA